MNQPVRTKGVTPLLVYSGDDIDYMNDRVWTDIQKFGLPLRFGSVVNPNMRKSAWEIFSVMQFYGKALDRLYAGDVPKGWRYKGKAVTDYANMLRNPDPGDQPYTYGQRLHDWEGRNQLRNVRDYLKASIKTGVQTNRIVGVILHPDDIYLEDPPCFNWYQVRLMEDNLVSLRTIFRSHAYVDASFANYCGIVKVFTDEVIKPAGGVLSEYINVSTSAQIESTEVDVVFDRVGNWFNFRNFTNACTA